MSERPTPETDAESWISGDAWEEKDEVVDSEFSRKLERERDEARDDAAHWKTEYEIVVARLRGRKHPRDNGIVAPDEIILMLTRERDEARERAERYRLEANAMMMQRDEAREVAEQLYDAAAYGLAQWESVTPATLSKKIVPALQAFQKLKAQ